LTGVLAKEVFDENPNERIFERNELFTRLINNEDFMSDCKNRWMYLRQEVWTEEFIFDLISDIYIDYKEFIEIDTDIWKPITVNDESLVYNRYLYSTNEFYLEDYVNNLFIYIPERLSFCDEYFIEQ